MAYTRLNLSAALLAIGDPGQARPHLRAGWAQAPRFDLQHYFADYLALASHFQTLFVERIPALKTSQRNEAKRFVLLIDTLYDARVHLVASSAQPPERIYLHGDHRFEFARTVSRLQEMQSAAWWGQKIVET